MKKKYLKFPAIIFLLCSITCASTEELKKEDREKAILKQYSSIKQEKYARLLVDLKNYTTNGNIYQKKYHRYLIGVAGDIVENKNLQIVDGTIGFYFDKKSNDRNSLFLGLDIDTGIAFFNQKDNLRDEPLSLAVFDISENDNTADPSALFKTSLIKELSGSQKFAVLSEDDMNRGLILNGFQKERIKDRDTIVDAGRALRVERSLVFESMRKGESELLVVRLYNNQTGRMMKEINYTIKKDSDMQRDAAAFYKTIPSNRYNTLSEFKSKVPDYKDASVWFLKNKLKSIMDTLSSCETIFSEKEVVGMVIGFRWIRGGSRESVNIWIKEKDLLLLEKSRLAFSELLHRSTITDSYGKIIRLPI